MAAAVATPALTNATSPGRVCYDRRRVALKSSLSSEEKSAEIEEALDALDKLVDRLKVMYEQYFMGIQKQAPAHLHTDAERRIRDVAQMQIRNTALRYRFATIQQKFGSYNTYWKRTLREIESGRYLRNLSKLRRQVQRTGEALPEEILAAMPKRMREAIERDRAIALADAKRRNLVEAEPAKDDDTQPDQPRFAPPTAPPPPRRSKGLTTDPFADAGDEDIAAALSSLADEALAAIEPRPAPPPPTRPPASPSLPPVARPAPTAPPPVPRPAASIPPPLPPRPAPPSATAPPPIGAAPPRGATVPPPIAAAPRPFPRPPVPRSADVPGMTEAETRALYAKFVKAREVVGDKSEGFSYDKLVRTLQSQAPKILEQHKAQKVEFNVVIRDNKVILKAKPR